MDTFEDPDSSRLMLISLSREQKLWLNGGTTILINRFVDPIGSIYDTVYKIIYDQYIYI